MRMVRDVRCCQMMMECGKEIDEEEKDEEREKRGRGMKVKKIKEAEKGMRLKTWDARGCRNVGR